MSTYTTDIAAVARYQIEDRIRDAEARRVARAARVQTPIATGSAQPRHARRWIRFPRRAWA
jgi:hypothetical protein